MFKRFAKSESAAVVSLQNLNSLSNSLSLSFFARGWFWKSFGTIFIGPGPMMKENGAWIALFRSSARSSALLTGLLPVWLTPA
jgi:hypothetical protein